MLFSVDNLWKSTKVTGHARHWAILVVSLEQHVHSHVHHHGSTPHIVAVTILTSNTKLCFGVHSVFQINTNDLLRFCVVTISFINNIVEINSSFFNFNQRHLTIKFINYLVLFYFLILFMSYVSYNRPFYTKGKGKGSPYSITERRVPELISVLCSQPGAWRES